MPALPPPGMQIGGPEYGNIPAAYAGPEPFGGLVPGTAYTPATLIQQVSAATTVATPASLTVNFASTGAGNTLVVCVAVAATGTAPAFTTPTNWTAVGGAGGTTGANTLAGNMFIFPGGAGPGAQPGGLTSVVLSVTNANGIAAAFYEFDDNVVGGQFDSLYGAVAGNPARQSFANSISSLNGTPYTPSVGPVLFIAFECDVTGQAYTAANVGPGWVTDTTATSTTGATLVVIRPFHVVTTPAGGVLFQLAGSLAGAIAGGLVQTSLTLASTGNVYGGAASSQGIGASQAIGDGPCPKAGGAGGGF